MLPQNFFEIYNLLRRFLRRKIMFMAGAGTSGDYSTTDVSDSQSDSFNRLVRLYHVS
jgi:hypothetical protein